MLCPTIINGYFLAYQVTFDVLAPKDHLSEHGMKYIKKIKRRLPKRWRYQRFADTRLNRQAKTVLLIKIEQVFQRREDNQPYLVNGAVKIGSDNPLIPFRFETEINEKNK